MVRRQESRNWTPRSTRRSSRDWTSRRFPTSPSRRACGRAASSATTSAPRSTSFRCRATRSATRSTSTPSGRTSSTRGSSRSRPGGQAPSLERSVGHSLHVPGRLPRHRPRARQCGPHGVLRLADRTAGRHRRHDSAQRRRRGRPAPDRPQAARPHASYARTACGRSSSVSPSGSTTRPASGTRSPPGTAGRPRRSPSGRRRSPRKISTPTSWG